MSTHDTNPCTTVKMPKAPTAIVDAAVASSIWLRVKLRAMVDTLPTADGQPATRMSFKSASFRPASENLKMMLGFLKCSSIMTSATR